MIALVALALWLAAPSIPIEGVAREREPRTTVDVSPSAAAARLVFGGDVALARVVAAPAAGAARMRLIGGDTPFGAAAEVLRGADLALVNLEGALWDGPLGRGRDDVVRLVAPSARARVLADAGVDVVSLANNHALDAGVDGLALTAKTLAALDVAAVGTRARPVVIRTLPGGMRVAIAAVTDRKNAGAATDGVAYVASAALERAMVRSVRSARDALGGDVGVVVVSVHWGREGARGPDRRQRAAARAAIDAGATLVVGHGAHVVQALERYGAGVIAYGLGNLVFDMGAHTSGALLRVELDAAGAVASAELTALDAAGAGLNP